MVATEEAQEEEVGVQMSVVCQETFYLALRIIAFRSTLSKVWITTKHPSLRRLFRHNQTAVNLLAIYIRRYIYICVFDCFCSFSVQCARCFSLRMRSLSMVLSPYNTSRCTRRSLQWSLQRKHKNRRWGSKCLWFSKRLFSCSENHSI